MLHVVRAEAPSAALLAPSVPLLRRLTAETEDWHAAVDCRLYASVTTPTLGGYRYFLATIYGFQAALETELRQTPGLDRDFLERRLHTQELASDLMVLGLSRAEQQLLRRRPSIPSLARVPEALGWMYVTERLTLQHDGLRDRLINALPSAVLSAGAYVSASRYARPAWREFGTVLDQVGSTPALAQRVVGAAHAAFGELQEWLAGIPMWDGF